MCPRGLGGWDRAGLRTQAPGSEWPDPAPSCTPSLSLSLSLSRSLALSLSLTHSPCSVLQTPPDVTSSLSSFDYERFSTPNLFLDCSTILNIFLFSIPGELGSSHVPHAKASTSPEGG